MSDGHTDAKRSNEWYIRKQSQATQSGTMRATLCTYEHPAAQHDIDSWRESMEAQGRIHQWMSMTSGIVKVLIKDGGKALPNVVEEMIICPLASHPHGLIATEFMEMARSREWDKWIHFGKMLLTPEQYRVAASRVANLRQPRQSKQLGSEGI